MPTPGNYRYSNNIVIPSVEKAEIGIRDIALAADVVLRLTKLVNGPNDHLHIEVSSNEKNKIDRFIQILENAIENYKKFSNPGGIIKG